jgi:hypothetical protein
MRLVALVASAILFFFPSDSLAAVSGDVAVAGGAVTAVTADHGKVYAGSGARLLVFEPDSGSPSGYSRTGSTPPLADLVRGVLVQNGTAMVAAGAAGLWLFDVSQAGDPVAIASLPIPGYAEGVAAAGKLVLVADGPLGLRVVDVSNPAQPEETGWAFEGKQAMAVAVRDHYALVAAGGAGLLVADIANPARPVELAAVAISGYATGVVVSGDFAYVMESWGGIGIVNIANPAEPTLASTFATPGWAVKGAATGATLAVADAYRGVRALSILDPLHPVETGASETYLGDAADVAADGHGIWVADRHDGLRLIPPGRGSASVPVYDTFSGAWSVAISGGYAYVAAMERGLRIVNISDPSRPHEVGVYPAGNVVSVTVNYPYAYLTVNMGEQASGGFHVVDVSDPAHPRRVGYRPGYGRDHTSVGSTAYVTNEAGLRVMDASDPANPVMVGYVLAPPGGPTLGVQVRGKIAYVAQESGGLVTFDVSDPAAPKVLGHDPRCDSAQDVALSGNYAVVAGMGGSCIVDISDPAKPQTLQLTTPLSGGRGSSVNGTQIYLTATGAGVQAFDIARPGAPTPVGSFQTPGYPRKAIAQNGRLWIADAETGLWSVALTSLSPPQTAPGGPGGTPMSLARRTGGGPIAVPVLPPPPASSRAIRARAEQAAGGCVVSSAADSGAGTLRDCLAGAGPGDTITFNPSVFPPASPHTIRLLSPLPPLTQGRVTLDASAAGVMIEGSALGNAGAGLTVLSNGNTIQGLHLASFRGVALLVTGGASDNVIGGDRTQGTGPQGRGNQIDNGGMGIVISGAGTNGNVAIGNYMGVQDGMHAGGWYFPTGDAPVVPPSLMIGDGAKANRVGSTVPGERNLFGTGGGLVITGPDTTDNVAIGNYIGINATGTDLLLCNDTPCQAGSILIQDRASRNRIGGTGTGEGNVVVGGENQGIGVNDLGSVDNVIIGNYIGTDATGTTALGIPHFDVWLDGMASRTRVERNVIAHAIGLSGDYNVAVGNRIGTDVSGRKQFGAQGGVFSANQTMRRNRIGGTAAGEANVIAGSAPLILLSAPGTESNYVIGNLIGADTAGAVLPMQTGASNPGALVGIGDGAKRNVIGGSTEKEGNLVAGSSGNGIGLCCAGNFIGRNWIGTNLSGSMSLGNRRDGIAVSGADHTFIMGNHIAANGGIAVSNQGGATTIRANSIHDNGGGISVMTFPPTAAPTINNVSDTWVLGTACPGCMVEVFSDAGNEGAYFEGAVRANASGAFALVKASGFQGPHITATATDSSGLTSPFSAPVSK